MLTKLRLIGCAALIVVVSGAFGLDRFARLAPTDLMTEFRENPIGLDTPSPRLSWRLPEGTVRQSAYELEIDGVPQGRVESSESQNIVWSSAALTTSQRVMWRVRIWNEAGNVSGWSSSATFTMGVMRPEDWRAKWIGPAPETRPDFDFGAAQWITAPADTNGVVTLKTTFLYEGAQPMNAVEMAHVGVSQHEIEVNGKVFHKWWGMVFDWRYPRFRDLTPYLVKGTNTVVVRVFADVPRQPTDAIDPICVHAPQDVRAFLARINFPDGRTYVTDAADWTSPNGAVTELGSVRETVYGKQLKLRTEAASPAFAKSFVVTKPIRTATVHITGLGFYEAYLNGKKMGRKVLDPAPTDYTKHVLYSTYAVDSAIQQGTNELKILLGHGWYDVRAIVDWNFDIAPWRDFPRCLAQLEIVYSDGTKEIVATDRSWQQVENPVDYNDIYEGEVVGVRNLTKKPLFSAPLNAVEVSGPAGRLVAETQPGTEVVREIPVKQILPFDGGYILDFGENIVGWTRLTLRGQQKGDVVTVCYDEHIQPDGTATFTSVSDGLHDFPFSDKSLSNEVKRVRRIDRYFHYTASHCVLPTPDASIQTDHFVCSGAADEVYEPRFAYYGFRYVVIRGLRQPPTAADVKACFVRTAFPVIGSFACSDEAFNRLMAAGVRSYEGNFTVGVPTDCPQREMNGWTGDAAIASALAQYVFENTKGYEKWLRDVCDAQLPNGNLPGIVPTSGWGYHWGNGPAWDAALSVIPWNLWVYRGNRRILDEIYPYLVHYLAYTATLADADGLVAHGLGDWVPVNKAHRPTVEYTSSCYYYQAQRIAAEIARMKGLAEDASRYDACAAKTKAAIRAKYARGNGVYDNGWQTAQAFALAFGIVTEAERPAVEAKLVRAVEQAGGHVDMGNLGMTYAFRALSRAGRTDLAWRMLTNPTAPSPMYWIYDGGTTLRESWVGGTSYNHIMFGDFVGWAYAHLAGIRLAEATGSTEAVKLPTAPAFRELVIEPVFLKELDWLSASTITPYGRVAVSWRRVGEKIAVEVIVPPGARAEIRLPGQPAQFVATGTWSFNVP